MRRTAVFAVAFSLSATLCAFAQPVSKDPSQAPTGTYAVDVKHTQVLFSILHLGLADFHGRFDKISGTLTFDGKQPERSALAITIDMTSVDTPNAALNGDLKTVFRI